MSSLKYLRSRISSVASIRKITSAMKMVAASKLRRAEEKLNTVKLYSENAYKMLTKLHSEGVLKNEELFKSSNAAPTLVILFSADRGLCGGFNSSVYKKFKSAIHLISKDKKNFYCFPMGKKAQSFLHKNYEVRLFDSITVDDKFDFLAINELAKALWKKNREGEIGSIQLVYTTFKNVINVEPVIESVLPISSKNNEDDIKQNKAITNAITEVEPKPNKIFDDLFQFFIASRLLHAYTQSQVSEHAARMSAMDSATRNADEMVDDLRLKYNRTRQSIITKELIEIISGAESSSAS